MQPPACEPLRCRSYSTNATKPSSGSSVAPSQQNRGGARYAGGLIFLDARLAANRVRGEKKTGDRSGDRRFSV